MYVFLSRSFLKNSQSHVNWKRHKEAMSKFDRLKLLKQTKARRIILALAAASNLQGRDLFLRTFN